MRNKLYILSSQLNVTAHGMLVRSLAQICRM